MSVTLLIDAGNTRIKIGLSHQTDAHAKPVFQYLGAIATHTQTYTADLFTVLNTNTSGVSNQINQVIGVCVAGFRVAECIEQAILAYYPYLNPVNSITWLKGDTTLPGLINDYATPHTLGADRWLAIYGIFNQLNHGCHSPCILATLGTATTIDVLYWEKSQAHFAGGIITAGLNSHWKLLHSNTANLPDINQLNTPQLNQLSSLNTIPNTTDTALFAGALATQIGSINVLINTTNSLYGKPQLYLSGGASAYVHPYFLEAILVNTPVLTGLAAYANT
jgi:type III pantothenate kinase